MHISSQGKCLDEMHCEITKEETNPVEINFQKIINYVMNFNYRVECDKFDSIDDFITNFGYEVDTEESCELVITQFDFPAIDDNFIYSDIIKDNIYIATKLKSFMIAKLAIIH